MIIIRVHITVFDEHCTHKRKYAQLMQYTNYNKRTVTVFFFFLPCTSRLYLFSLLFFSRSNDANLATRILSSREYANMRLLKVGRRVLGNYYVVESHGISLFSKNSKTTRARRRYYEKIDVVNEKGTWQNGGEQTYQNTHLSARSERLTIGAGKRSESVECRWFETKNQNTKTQKTTQKQKNHCVHGLNSILRMFIVRKVQ